MVNLDDLPFVHSDMEIDMLGDAYEFLIGRFAATAGKKAGEFYTPQQVSKILAKMSQTVKINYVTCTTQHVRSRFIVVTCW
ncbi:N-6 DNA methylase [Staphylococcus aureus]